MQIGRSYSNKEIVETFRVGQSGGIRVSFKTNSIVLISDRFRKHPYEDSWDEKELLYHLHGQGLKGDQELSRNNLTLANAHEQKLDIHLFITHKPKVHIYYGRFRVYQFAYASKRYPDINNQLRKVLLFDLEPLDLVEGKIEIQSPEGI